VRAKRNGTKCAKRGAFGLPVTGLTLIALSPCDLMALAAINYFNQPGDGLSGMSGLSDLPRKAFTRLSAGFTPLLRYS
jgi:hypothetical protein